MKTAALATLLVLALASSAFAGLTPGPVVANGQSLPIVADLDGNGLDDIILDRSVLLNFGNGQFTSHDLNLAATEQVVDWLDLNGDGRKDLMTRDQAPAGPAQPPGSTTYRIYLATGNMTFGAGIVINTGGTAVPYIADVNGDGKDDIVLVRAIFNGIPEVASEWTVLLSRGDGTFDARPSFRTVPNPQFGRYDHHLLVADMNHDGIPDIVVRGVYDLLVLRGTGGGDFVVQKRFLPNAPFGTWSTGLADIDGDGNLDVVLAGFRSVRVLFGDGHGGFTRVATANIAKLRSVTVPDYLAPMVSDQAQAPRNLAFGQFVASGRTEIAAGTAEGDVVILAFVQNKLQEVSRTATEFILPDIYRGAFLQPGREDLYVTWNLGYGDPASPKPRLFSSQPSLVANVASQSRGRGHASLPTASPLTVSFQASGACVPAEVSALTVTKDGIFGIYQDTGQTLETVIDDDGTIYARLDASWLAFWIMSTLSPADRGYAGTALASTSCGPQTVSFAAER